MYVFYHLSALLKINRLILFSLILLPLTSFNVKAQEDSKNIDGITIIVEEKDKSKNSYIFISGGYQAPAWIRVPMTPENSPDIHKQGNMKVQVPGWFTGFGIIKKTKSRFEAGLLADYYKSCIPVAYSGQRSTSDWVYEQNFNTGYFTQVFEDDILRVNETLSFRGVIRYKIPVPNFSFWGGLTGGTFSSKISFNEASYVETSLGASLQAGIDFNIKDAMEKDLFSISLFSDFLSPKIHENMISLFNPNWMYVNSDGNYSVNPFRIGVSVGIHVK